MNRWAALEAYRSSLVHVEQHQFISTLRLLTLALLTDCGGSDDPMASFLNQTAVWQACAAHRRVRSRVGTDARRTCQLRRLSCVDGLRTPRTGGDHGCRAASSARKPTNRHLVLINPGGPVDALLWVLKFWRLWNLDQVNGVPSVMQTYQAIAQGYNLIGFSSRGAGLSTRQECSPTQELLPVADRPHQLNPTNIDKTLFNTQPIALGCQDQPRMRHITTDATARDMDLMSGKPCMTYPCLDAKEHP